MKILERAKTPEGIDIQIEDWKQDYSCFNTFNIATYPIAKRSSESGWIKDGKTFRLDISRGFNNDEEVKQAFNDLVSGNKNISDFADQFYNGDKDKYLFGLLKEVIAC